MNYSVSNYMIVWTGGGQQSFGIPGKNVHSATGFRVVVGGYRQLLAWHWSQRGIQCCTKKLGYWVTTVTFICMSSIQTVWCNTFFFFFHLAIIKTSLQPVRENTVFPNDLWLPGNRWPVYRSLWLRLNPVHITAVCLRLGYYTFGILCISN